MKKEIATIMLVFGLLNTGFSQEYLREDVIKLTKISTDKKYGFTKKKPIKTGSVEKGYHYLKALKGPNGEKVMYQRKGSCCSFKSKSAVFGKGFLDVYEVWYKGAAPVTLYINGYEQGNLKSPIGFSFVTADQIKPIKTLDDSIIKKTTVCDSEHVFSVDDYLLKEAIGEKKKPDTTPQFEGGIDNLKDYFKENSLTDKRALEMMFRVKIGFKVNCKGETGDFKVISKGKGDLKELANLVLEVVNNMPPNWAPAEFGDKKIDCYQILSFTVVGGSLEKVSYK